MDRTRAADEEPSGRHTLVMPGEPPLTIDSPNWLVALGIALELLERHDTITRLACEVRPSGTIVARDGVTGEQYVLHPGEFEEIDPEDLFLLPATPARAS